MSTIPYSDPRSMRINARLMLVVEELRAQGGEIPPALDGYLDVQARYAEKLGEYEMQDILVRQEAITRKTLRVELVNPLQAGWEHVRTAGASGSRKPALQVEQERKLLFPYGRPDATSPGDHALIAGTETLLSLLTGDSALARAWPTDNLIKILEARDAFVPVYKTWTQAVVRRATILTELEQLRTEWYQDLGWLRDSVKRTMQCKGLPNRYASLFRYRKPVRGKAGEEEQPVEPPPPPPDPSSSP